LPLTAIPQCYWTAITADHKLFSTDLDDERSASAMQDALVQPARTDEPQQAKTPRKAAISAWIGSALE
jgi:hypothetical protein